MRRDVPGPLQLDAPTIGLYTINITLGTPPQQLTLQLDTGSSDLIVPSAEFCSEAGDNAGTTCGSGTFSASDSSSFESVPGTLNASYGDQSQAVGDYAVDTLSIGGLDVGNVIFGIGLDMSSSFSGGILGIGYVMGEAALGQQLNLSMAYPNVPVLLARRGIIRSAAYSLWLNEQGSDVGGTILFGGIDTEKFEGDLVTVPVIPDDLGLYDSLQIALSNVSYGGDTMSLGNASDPVPATLDSGSSRMMLPLDIVQFLYEKLNVDNTTDGPLVNCDLRDSKDPITFAFSEAVINVAMSQVVLGPDNTGQCIFGVSPLLSNLPVVILGDTFLTSAYVVYNLQKNEISLAQAKYGSDKSNIVEIGTGDSALPSASSENAGPRPTAGAGSVVSLVLALSAVLALV